MADNRNLKITISAVTSGAITSIKKLKSGIESLSNVAVQTAKIFAALGTAAVATGGVFLNAAGKTEQWEIAFSTLLGSASKAKTLLEDIKTFAATTPFEITGLVDSSKRLIAFGIETEKIIPTMRMLGDIAAGVGTDKLPTLVDAFGKIKTKGKASMEELNRILEAGVPILDSLSESFGVSTNKIIKMVSEGKIGFEDIDNALNKITTGNGKFANLMEKQSKSFFGVISNIKDNLTQTSIAIGEELLPKAKELAEAIQKFTSTENLPKFLNAIKNLFINIETEVSVATAILKSLIAEPFSFETYRVIFSETLDKTKLFWEALKKGFSGVNEFRKQLIEDEKKDEKSLSDKVKEIRENGERKKRDLAKKTSNILSDNLNKQSDDEANTANKIIDITKKKLAEIEKEEEEAAETRKKIGEDFAKEIIRLTDEQTQGQLDLVTNYNRSIEELNKSTTDKITSLNEALDNAKKRQMEQQKEREISLNYELLDLKKSIDRELLESENLTDEKRREILDKYQLRQEELIENNRRKNEEDARRAVQLEEDTSNKINENQIKLNYELLDLKKSIDRELLESENLTDEKRREILDKYQLRQEELSENNRRKNEEDAREILRLEEETSGKIAELEKEKNKKLSELDNQRKKEKEANEKDLLKIIGSATKTALVNQINATVAAAIAEATASAIAAAIPTFGGSLLGLAGQTAGIVAAGETAKGVVNSIKFAQGGIVPGNSTVGDSQIARVNSGEMILSKDQQTSLFKMINSGGGGGTTININGGVFMGDQNQAKQFAKMIDKELVVLRRQGQRVSS